MAERRLQGNTRASSKKSIVRVYLTCCHYCRHTCEAERAKREPQPSLTPTHAIRQRRGPYRAMLDDVAGGQEQGQQAKQGHGTGQG